MMNYSDVAKVVFGIMIHEIMMPAARYADEKKNKQSITQLSSNDNDKAVSS